jgi:hypothetical protein
MVFFLVALAASRLSRRSIALISAVIALAVELFRLVHTPALDAFRLTLAGALLLGRIFSPWDLLAYGVGIMLAVGLDRIAERLSPNSARVSSPSGRGRVSSAAAAVRPPSHTSKLPRRSR